MSTDNLATLDKLIAEQQKGLDDIRALRRGRTGTEAAYIDKLIANASEHLKQLKAQRAQQRGKGKVIPLSLVVRGHVGIRNAVMMLGEHNSDPKLRAAVARELGALARKGLTFERSKGSKNGVTPAIEAHVKDLVARNRKATKPQLYRMADRAIIDKPNNPMFFDTFKRYVTKADKALGITRRAGRPAKK